MIVFFVTRKATNTLLDFFETWGERLLGSIRIVHYETLGLESELPGAATYVFTDLERLATPALPAVAALADELAGSSRVLNHPQRVLRRYELLQVLHERGFNPFRAHRAWPAPDDLRYPVFLRSEHGHTVLSGLLRSRREVDRWLIRLHLDGHELSSLLAVEYEDVADDEGMFHRYTSHVIGDAYVPGYLAFSSQWVVKAGPFVEGERREQQRRSVLSNEHAPYLRELAELAGVGYGRFDYAVSNGRILVWELNTSPTLMLRIEHHRPQSLPEFRPHADRLCAAFATLTDGVDRPPVKVRLPTDSQLLAAPRPRTPLRLPLARRLGPVLLANTGWLGRRKQLAG